MFSCEQIDHLNTFQINVRADSSFVSYIVKYLYAENLDLVANKSSCGRSNKKGGEKKAMTPVKKKLLSDVYAVRLHNYVANIEERNSREKRLNKLIKDAFASISKSVKEKETLRIVT